MKSFCVAYAAGLVGVICVVVSVTEALPIHTNRNRTTRGFKNAALSTARGFGKRADFAHERNEVDDSPSDRGRELFGKILRERAETDSYPAEWFAEELAGNAELGHILTSRLAEELVNNRELAQLITSKIIDQNMDGELTPEELLRSTY